MAQEFDELSDEDELDGAGPGRAGRLAELLDQGMESELTSSLHLPPLTTKRRVLPMMVLGQGHGISWDQGPARDFI